MAKKPNVELPVNASIKFVEDTLNYIRKLSPANPGAVHPDIIAMEDAVDGTFADLDHQQQAHIMFFAIMILTKLARLQSREGNVYSNPVVMAQTFYTALSKIGTTLNMGLVDIAFELIRLPTYEMQDGDAEEIVKLIDSFRLANMEPKGNA